jgi:hypothetical protein
MRPASPSRLHIARWTLLAVWLLAGGTATRTWADDLENMQGTWVSEYWPWTVEFRDSTATFRGVNPFSSDPPMDEPLPEFKVRFTLDSSQSPKRLNVNEEDFAKFRELLESTGVTAHKNDYAKPWTGIYQIGSARDGQAPHEMRLEFHFSDRSWVRKGPQHPSLIKPYVPLGTLRRLSPAELALYAKVSGVWQGELRQDKAVFKGSCAIVPGWVLYDFHHDARMRLVLSDKADEFTLRQMLKSEENALSVLFGFSIPRELIWRGKFKLESASSLAIESNAHISLAGKDLVERYLKDAGESLNDSEQADFQKLFAEQVQPASAVTTTLTKMKQPAGEHPLLGLARALRPELPSSEHLSGAWKLTRKARFDRAKSDAAQGSTHFEPVEINDAETWTFADGKLTITSVSGERNEVYLAQHQIKCGFLKLKLRDSDQDLAGFFSMKLVGESLQLLGSFKSAQSAFGESWQFTLSREKDAANNTASSN